MRPDISLYDDAKLEEALENHPLHHYYEIHLKATNEAMDYFNCAHDEIEEACGNGNVVHPDWFERWPREAEYILKMMVLGQWLGRVIMNDLDEDGFFCEKNLKKKGKQ